ncbi:hypothetical protein F5148DRAFT_829760 [Russula earlei]|uniref:Uncharacterized protein n=1 Tax=Russula earlei TaxID=71964 RepID=A0ACC0TUQ9_9AGAM|nr:hypothetical protein F5148DRAFT_829760 [Russula earlei]
MTNFNDVNVIAQDFWALVKFWHAIDGLYIWEFFTTLDYEWSIIQRRRPYRSTIWLYSITRVATLLAVITNMIGFDANKRINCQLWVTFEIIFAYSAFAAASMLIVLRVIAIWNKSSIISVIALSVWTTNVGFLIQGIVRLRGTWSVFANTCIVTNSTASKLNITVSLSTDTILLVMMLVGLIRWRVEEGPASGFGRFLWTQGLIWLLLATLAYVPAVVFISLNLNEPFNLMFQTPALITMSIAATRMYRSLSDFSSRGSTSLDYTKSTGLSGSSDNNRVRVAPIQLNPMEVSVHTDSEQYPASQVGQYASFVITDGQLGDKPHGLDVEDDVESGHAEK